MSFDNENYNHFQIYETTKVTTASILKEGQRSQNIIWSTMQIICSKFYIAE